MARRSRSKMNTVLRQMGHSSPVLFETPSQNSPKMQKVSSKTEVKDRESKNRLLFKGLGILVMIVIFVWMAIEMLTYKHPGIMESSIICGMMRDQDRIALPLIKWVGDMKKILTKQPDTTIFIKWKTIAETTAHAWYDNMLSMIN